MANEITLRIIVEDLRHHGPTQAGICHGARSGFEVARLQERLDSEVIGTDISETANDFPDMHVRDFHDNNPDWNDRVDLVYGNSLDQALELDVQATQITR